MKTMTMVQDIDKSMNALTKHAMTLERDNMLLKKAIRTMASKMYTDEHGNISMGLSQEDSDFIKSVSDTCDIFNSGITKGE